VAIAYWVFAPGATAKPILYTHGCFVHTHAYRQRIGQAGTARATVVFATTARANIYGGKAR